MKLNNPFSQTTHNLYLYVFACQDCGRSDNGLSLHHITGRGSNSKLNAIVLCNLCHGKCGHSFEEESRYSKITVQFHLREGTILTGKDIEYYKNNMLLY